MTLSECLLQPNRVFIFPHHGRDLSQFWVLDSACSINLTTFRSDFVTFDTPSTPSRVGGVGVDVKGSGTARISIVLASVHSIYHTIHALYTSSMSSRAAQRIGRLLGVTWIKRTAAVNSFFLLTLLYA
jgi:hypothetical protein